jgi:hypothetical protein
MSKTQRLIRNEDRRFLAGLAALLLGVAVSAAENWKAVNGASLRALAWYETLNPAKQSTLR